MWRYQDRVCSSSKEGARQLFLTMEYSHLAVAAILCSIGYVYCTKCTSDGGNLYIMQLSDKSEKFNMQIEVHSEGGVSETKESLAEYDIQLLDTVPVTNCLVAMLVLRHELNECVPEEVKDDVHFTGSSVVFSLPHSEYDYTIPTLKGRLEPVIDRWRSIPSQEQ